MGSSPKFIRLSSTVRSSLAKIMPCTYTNTLAQGVTELSERCLHFWRQANIVIKMDDFLIKFIAISKVKLIKWYLKFDVIYNGGNRYLN